jgi:hypothetical protein
MMFSRLKYGSLTRELRNPQTILSPFENLHGAASDPDAIRAILVP